MKEAEPTNTRASQGRWTLLALYGICLAALIVRLWGTDYGLPYIYHTDEIFEVKRALKLGALQLDFHRAFKGGLYYILFVEYGALYIVLRLLGEIRSTLDFLVRFFNDPTEFWMLGRITVTILGTLNVLLVYRLGRSLRSARTGLLAALFVAFAAGHVDSSQYITVDILMLCFLTLTCIQIARMIDSGKQRSYLLAALFAGLAVSTKLTAITILIPIALARAHRVRIEQAPLHRLVLDKRVLLAFGSFIVTMAIVNPSFFPGLLNLLRRLLGAGGAGPLSTEMDPFPSRTDNIVAFYINALIASMGLPVVILSACGIILALHRRLALEICLLAFALATFLLICFPWQPDLIYNRYTLPIQIILALFAASFLDQALDRFHHSRWTTLAGGMLILVAVAIPLSRTLRLDYLKTQTDTRTSAKEWIEESIPAGAKILIEGRGYGSSPNTAPLRNTVANMMEKISSYRRNDPRWTTDSSYGPLKDRFHRAAVTAQEQKQTYDLVPTSSGAEPCLRLSEYIDNGVEYVLIDPEKLARFLTGLNYERFPAVGNLYKDILESPKLHLMRRFEPADCLGPVLEIYRVEEEK